MLLYPKLETGGVKKARTREIERLILVKRAQGSERQVHVSSIPLPPREAHFTKTKSQAWEGTESTQMLWAYRTNPGRLAERRKEEVGRSSLSGNVSL